MKNKESCFCPIPWTLVNITTEGMLRVCPASQASETKGITRDSDKRPINIQADGLSPFFNNELANQLRLNMLKGIKTPEVCQRCYEDEDAGVYSRRQMEFDKAYISYSEAESITRDDGSIVEGKTPIKEIDARLGNHCNLSCRMCSPQSSSGWYQEWYETRFKGFKDEGGRKQLEKTAGKVHLKDRSYKWYESQNLYDFIADHGSNIADHGSPPEK